MTYEKKESLGWVELPDKAQEEATNDGPIYNETEDVKQQQTPLQVNSAQFIADFEPPDYLIEGLVLKRNLYSCTSPTGWGKTAVWMRIAAHVAMGLPLGGREVMQGRVLYFAGENPDDIRMRWIKLCEEIGVDTKAIPVWWVVGTLKLSSDYIKNRIIQETKKDGPFDLVIVDTSAAYFDGDDENSNKQLGDFARDLRDYIKIRGGPTVVALCHPIKNYNPEELSPRGGGAFVAEVDGNFVCLKDNTLVRLWWHVKLRGADFAPIPFQLNVGTTERLKDSKGRPIPTVTAAPISDKQEEDAEKEQRSRENTLLLTMFENPGASIRDIAEKSGISRSAVDRMVKALTGLVKKTRGGQWELTGAGEREAKAINKRTE